MIAVMVPDYKLIAEVILYCSGVPDARVPATKLINLFTLMSELISKQDHYDFGAPSLLTMHLTRRF